MSVLRIVMIAFVSLAGAGCFGRGSSTVVIPDDNDVCVISPGSSNTQQTPVLVKQGNDYLDRALRGLASPEPETGVVTALLSQSSICFSRALHLTPDSYEAQLSMGVAYLARARVAEKDSVERANMLNGARHMLGRAYMLRHGAYEPLYYLAELAMAEGNLELAKAFLEPLRVAGVKEGPVHLLLGGLSERGGEKQEAMAFYLKVLDAGWPIEAFMFAADRLQKTTLVRLKTSSNFVPRNFVPRKSKARLTNTGR